MVLAFASCKCSRARLPFIQASFKKETVPSDLAQHTPDVTDFVVMLQALLTLQMIGDAQTKPEREKLGGLFILEQLLASKIKIKIEQSRQAWKTSKTWRC